MQRIINALAKNKNTVLFVFLLIISIYFLNSRSYFHQTKINKLINKLMIALDRGKYIRTKKNYKKTEGCIAIKKIDLLKIIKEIKINTKVKIEHQR